MLQNRLLFLVSDEGLDAAVIGLLTGRRKETTGNLPHLSVISHALTTFLPL